jgi:hypothetical protein
MVGKGDGVVYRYLLVTISTNNCIYRVWRVWVVSRSRAMSTVSRADKTPSNARERLATVRLEMWKYCSIIFFTSYNDLLDGNIGGVGA